MHETETEQKTDAAVPIRSLIFKLLTIVVDEDREEKVTAFLREHSVRLQYACGGKGTANSELLDLLGLDGSDKALLFCLMPDFQASALLKLMPEKLDLEKNGRGIAFTLPLSGICNPILQMFSEETLTKIAEIIDPAFKDALMIKAGTIRERMEQLMENETERLNVETVKHDLLIAVVNQGCSEELMEVAKAAGAGGGTVLNARRTGLDDAATFLGMPVQAQKDIIMILTDRKLKMAIMKVINHGFGINTPARGIVFSLPVDSVAGLHAAAAQ